MAKTILFDVNETLLDLAALDSLFERHLGDAALRSVWFSQVLATSMTMTLVGDYADFAEVGRSALAMIAERVGVVLGERQKTEIVEGFRSLPAHRDVAGGLALLREGGYRLVTLTNSSAHFVEAQLANAGIASYFQRSLSADQSRMFKPATAVYKMAAAELGEPVGALWPVAAHNWDTTGASAAGLKSAFVARPGMVTGDLDREPNVRGSDLGEIARGILAPDNREVEGHRTVDGQ